MEEIWKEIKGYSMYLVSNYGRVWSKTRIIKNKNGNSLRKGKIRTPQNDGAGYVRYVLVNDEGMSNIELASKFNVSRQTIWKIVTFQTHKELQEDE